MNKGQLGLIAAFFLFLSFGMTTAEAQQRFTVQSGGRGMENAKHSAQIRQIQVKNNEQDTRLGGHDTRLGVVESDIKRIADHAWKELSQCGVGSGSGGAGYKITWNPAGTGTWGCIQETDPTVKAFAKTNLPNCGAGQVLRADGNSFSCTTSAGTSGFEVDPYVQDFARNTVYTINACASDEVLTMTSKRLRCIKSQDLNITETDPTVQPFAKAALPECAAGQVLTTGVGGGGVGMLRCVTDTDGGYAELDPSVGTITNTKWCMASGGKIHCNQNPPVLTETDPTVKAFAKANLPTCAAGKVLTGNGTALSCADAGVTLGGSNTQVQYNNNGSLAGHGGFTYNGAGALTITGAAVRAISGTSTSTAGWGVYGAATATTGTTYGVSGRSDSPDGRAVYGYATAASGATYGVSGLSNSTSGRGVYGFATAAAGTAYGVAGQSSSTSGRGVYGYVTAASGETHGVSGLSNSTSGKGVYGAATAASGTTYGVAGQVSSTAGRAVYGYATASSGTTYGVLGQASSPDGYGVYSQGNAHVQGDLRVSGKVTAASYYQSSDRNLKSDITRIENPFVLLRKVSGNHYKWKDSGKHAYGVIAQDVEIMMPEAVKTDENGVKSVEYSQLIAPLVEAVKQLESRVRELEAEKVQPAKAQPRIDHYEQGVFRLFNN